MLGHRELTLEDYLMIARRRWVAIVIPSVLGPLIAYGISLKLPSRYTSQTLVLVEGQKVPDNFVKPVITEALNSRLSTIRERILSRSRLQPIIERSGVFREEASRTTMEDLLDWMRKAILVTPVQSVVNTGAGDVPGFYIAVTLSDPRLAQQVCTEITSMFIEEDLRQREQSAQGTTTFLESQLQEAKRSLDEQDAKLAQFKRKYMGSLPDDTQTNLNLITSLNTQLEAATQSLNRAQQDKAYTESLLAQQRAAWESARQGNESRPETLEQQLSEAEKTLVALQARYTSDHPDVVKQKAAIEALKKKLSESTAAMAQKPGGKNQETSVVEPPEVQQLRSQLHGYDAVIQANTQEQEQLQGQIKLYQSRIQLSPVVEQEYQQVTRDHQTALEFYNDLLRKKDQSAMATDLERRQQAETFSVMDPANLPEKPSFPDRPLFAAAGLGGGLVLGISLALLFEMRDKSLRTERDIRLFLNLPTLAMIPSVPCGEEKKHRVRAPSSAVAS